MWQRGDIVEIDGLLGVVVASDEDGNVPEGHVGVWFGEPSCIRISQGGTGGVSPEVWTIPSDYLIRAVPETWRH